MNKEQSQQMFGTPNIDAWFDGICTSIPYIAGGRLKAAFSLLSDVQEQLAFGLYNDARQAINRIKYLLDSDQEFERRIVAALMRYLESKGFEITGVNDEGEHYNTNDPAVAMGHIFAVSMANLYVRMDGFGAHSILLIPSNGEDMISDYSYSDDDMDGFENAMKNFTPPEAV